ncbi:MAG: gliding motility protein GldM [Tannerellaceae bacterium]|nr:gliding motility protein GldM [Tannerellaceae bacterium]
MANPRKRTLSPRQRMINLMYLVFIALLALNISSDVLDGFNVLNRQISYTAEEMREHNNRTATELYERILFLDDSIGQAIPTILAFTDSVSNYIEVVKERIVHIADGEKGDVMNIRNGENREAVAHVMLSPVHGEARQIKQLFEAYNNFLINLDFNYIPFFCPENVLSPEWETTLFENCPVAVAILLLSKIQQDIRFLEFYVLDYFERNTGEKGIYNSVLKACIIPQKQHLLSGEHFNGKVVVYGDYNQNIRNVFFLNRQISLQNGNQFSFPVSSPGSYSIEGYAEVLTGGGNSSRAPFKTSYSVSEPAVTISPVKINVLYAGYANELRVAVPAVPSEQIQLTSTRGMVKCRSGNLWEIIPPVPGEQLQLIVSYPWKQTAKKDSVLFRVLQLPDPCAFLKDSRGAAFKGGTIGKQALLQYDLLESRYEDGLLDASFEILSFDLIWYDSFGNQLRERATGCWINERQKEVIKTFSQGKTCYFSSIQVKGEDGIIRTISPIEIVIN